MGLTVLDQSVSFCKKQPPNKQKPAVILIDIALNLQHFILAFEIKVSVPKRA